MNYCKPFLSLFTLCCFLNRDIAAQQPYFEELSSPSLTAGISLVNGIAADANHCIWLTTQSGIYRYDGIRFRNYSTLNTPALKFERMESLQTVLYQDKSSWCISDAKGNKYEIDSSSQLRLLEQSPGTKIIFGNRTLRASKQGKEIPLIFSPESTRYTYYSRGRDVFYVQLTDGRIASLPASEVLNQPPISFIPSPVPEHESITRFFTTDKGLYCFTPKGLARLENAGSPWHAVSLGGDILFNGDPDFDDIRVFAPPGHPSTLGWYRGNIYEITESAGTDKMNTRLLAKGSSTDIPSFLFYSPVDHLLVGCFLNKGLILYRPRQFSLLTYNDADQKVENYYYSLLPSANGYTTINNAGIVWLGIDGRSKLLAKGQFSVFYLFRDKAGNTWYQKKEPDKGSIYTGYLEAITNRQVYVYEAGFQNGLAGMYQQDDSTYYILFSHRLDLLIKSRSTSYVKTLIRFPLDIEYNVLFSYGPGKFWIGNDHGLQEYDIATKTLQSVTALANANVRAITKLSDNNFLVGTYDKWIYRYKNGQWLRLTSADKTVAPSAHAFITDSSSNSLWVSSNKGISRLPLREVVDIDMTGNGKIYAEHFTGFGKDISVEFNGSSNSSAALLSDSTAAFANASGLVVFDPRFLLTPPLPNKVLVEPVYDDDTLASNQGGKYQVRFSVAVPYFGNRGNLEVLYRMTNTGDDWHTLFPNAIISYNNLEPGDHDLQFRIRHHNDNSNEEVFITARSFNIPYRWYQKPWFKWLIAVLSMGLIIVLHNIRIWYLRKRKRELEQLVKLKTSELQDSNLKLSGVIGELRESEADLKQSNYLKDEYYAVLTHDLRSPLKFLSFNISQLLDLLPELDGEKLRKGLVVAYECTNDVHKLVDEFVYWIQNNENLLVPRSLPVHISAVIADIRKLYGFSFEGNKNNLVTEVSPELRFTSDQQILFIILRNAIDNANKYTSGGTIIVRAERRDGKLELMVSDTGVGIREEMAKELTELQYQNVQLGYKKRRSLGFYIMAMLIKKLNGHYTISSEKGKGTAIHFSIPESKEDKHA